MVGTRYNIIRLKVDRPGQIVRFQHKIPSYLKRCTGFVAKHVQGVQTDYYMPEIGWISASFNSLKEEAIVAPISAQPYYEPEEPSGFQTLDVSLKPGQLVVGVYVDSMKSNFFPYMVSLYLRCVPTARIQVSKQTDPSPKETKVIHSRIDAKSNRKNCEDYSQEDDNTDEHDYNNDQLCSII